MRRRMGVFALFFLFLQGSAPAQSARPPARLQSAALEKLLDPVVAKALDQAGTPGAVVAIVQNGEVVLCQGYGFANNERKTPVDPQRTLFYLASITKTFTATAVMQQVEQGKLRLDADVNTYLTRFKIPATFPQPVTLHHLLTHTAGYDDKNIGYVARTAAEARPLAEYLATDMPPRVRPPGQMTAYSNHGFGLAGHLVETVSGEPYSSYVEQHILHPLGMTHSTAQVPPPADLLADFATGYQWSRATNAPAAQALGARNLPPAGTVSASGADMARYLIAQLQGGKIGEARILQEESARAMQREQFTHHPALPGIGYAFYHWRYGHLELLEHGGAYLGYSAQMTLIPGQNMGIFVATNGSSASVANAIVTAFLESNFPQSAEPVARLQSPSAEFTRHLPDLNGAYHLTRYSRATLEKIAIWDGQIRVTASPDGAVTLASRNRAVQKYFEVAPLVFANEKGETLAFVTDSAGRISHLAMSIPVFHFPAAFEKLPWWEDLRVQLPVAFSCLAVFAATLTVWPLAALLAMLFRRWRKQPKPLRRTPHWVIAAAVASSALGLAFVGGLDALLGNSVYRTTLVYGLKPEMQALMCIPWAMLGLVPVLFFAAWKMASQRMGAGAARAFVMMLALASAVFIAFLWNLNLIAM